MSTKFCHKKDLLGRETQTKEWLLLKPLERRQYDGAQYLLNHECINWLSAWIMQYVEIQWNFLALSIELENSLEKPNECHNQKNYPENFWIKLLTIWVQEYGRTLLLFDLASWNNPRRWTWWNKIDKWKK